MSRVSGETPTLPDYAPVPPSAFGPAVNKQGYYVGRVERNLYWVSDGTYQARSPTRTASATRSSTSSTRTITPTTVARRRCSTRTSRASGTRRHGGSCFGTTTRRGPRPRKSSRTAAPSRSAANASSWPGSAPITRPTTSTSTCRTTTRSCSSTSSTPAGRRSTHPI